MANQHKPLLSPLANALSPLIAEHKVSYELLLTNYLKSHGLAESTKQIACARLAGMLVIIAALGEHPDSIVFNKTLDIPESWKAGVVSGAWYLYEAISENTDVLTLLKIALHVQAGKVGEAYINFNHPVSLLEDVYISSVCCEFLGIKLEMSGGSLMTRVINKSCEILDLNHQVFYLLFELFERDSGVGIDVVQKALSNVSLTELESLVKRYQ